ncbi:jun-like transcription factor [Coemansia sp. RSA 1804]|nr:jun-like transcription factor [Coemansia sp. RSA 1804]
MELHALLVERGLDRTLSSLVSEAAHVGKGSQEVQLFFESIMALQTDTVTQTLQLSHEECSTLGSSAESSSSESSSGSSYKSAKDALDHASSGNGASIDEAGSTRNDACSGLDNKAGNGLKQSAKKRKLPVETSLKPEANSQFSRKDGSSKTPFCRIRPEEVVYVDDRLKDNRYTAKGGTSGDFGYKAHKDLVVKHGKGFTKEKNKKKRGSYGGGRITMESHSIKFT